MMLVNGAEGVATGWSTALPCDSPLDIIPMLNQYLNRNSFGRFILPDSADRSGYEGVGVAERTGTNTIDIEELPLKTPDSGLQLYFPN